MVKYKLYNYTVFHDQNDKLIISDNEMFNRPSTNWWILFQHIPQLILQLKLSPTTFGCQELWQNSKILSLHFFIGDRQANSLWLKIKFILEQDKFSFLRSVGVCANEHKCIAKRRYYFLCLIWSSKREKRTHFRTSIYQKRHPVPGLQQLFLTFISFFLQKIQQWGHQLHFKVP